MGNTAGRALVAAILMGIVVVAVYGLFSNIGIYDAIGVKVGQIIAVLVSIGVGGIVYLIAGKFLRLGELNEFLKAIHR